MAELKDKNPTSTAKPAAAAQPRGATDPDERKPFTVEDLHLHRKVTEVHGVRGADYVVATLRSVDRLNDRYTSAVWSLSLRGGAPKQLTRGPGLDRSPRINPTGERVAFLSDRSDGLVQVFVIDRDGGEAQQCGNLPAGVASVAWLPDSTQLLIAAIVKVDSSGRGRADEAQQPSKVEVAWRLPYKSDGVGFLLSRQVHLFLLDVATGKAKQLTEGAFDVVACDISPDGNRIAYVRTREGRFAHRTDLWVCDRDGKNATQLTDQLATVTQPRWSPDGRFIALAGAQDEGDGQSALHVFDFEARQLRRLGDDVEVAALNDAVHWMDEDILFARALRGCHVVCRVARDGSNLRSVVSEDQQFGSLACARDVIVFAREHPAGPSEIFAFPLDEGRQHALSDFNPWWAQRTRVEAQRREFTVPDGKGGSEQIEGWVLRAAGTLQPQPLLNDVHGGPASFALLDFDTNVFWQVLCSRGWTILALNAVGSSSYGREFCTRLNGHWGELDLPQHLEAIRQLQQEGAADARISICGKSYGGFLSAWAIGHDERFKAAIVMAPVGNIETHYGTSDGGYYADPLYLGGTPPLDRQRARALSPLQYIEKSTTPTLFLQGKDDERCPKCQSEEMFASLYCAGKTQTQLILYPGENHHFLGEGAPACREDAAARIVEWLTRHVDTSSADSSARAGKGTE